MNKKFADLLMNSIEISKISMNEELEIGYSSIICDVNERNVVSSTITTTNVYALINEKIRRLYEKSILYVYEEQNKLNVLLTNKELDYIYQRMNDEVMAIIDYEYENGTLKLKKWNAKNVDEISIRFLKRVKVGACSYLELKINEIKLGNKLRKEDKAITLSKIAIIISIISLIFTIVQQIFI